jgi:predicted DNA binding protein
VLITLRWIYNPALPIEQGPLTPEQQAALVTAQNQGYFEVSRRITQSELAELIGISDRALSQRQHRDTSWLITEVIYGGRLSP